MLAGGSGITPMFQVCNSESFLVSACACVFLRFLLPRLRLHLHLCLFQVARAILENPKDNTKVYLIYANVTYEDILLKVIPTQVKYNINLRG